MALNVDEINALTLELVIPLIGDNVFTSNPLLARLHARGMKEQGGTVIGVPLMYAKVGAAGAIRGFDVMNIDADDQFTRVDYDWKEYYGAIVVSRREMLQNSGVPEQINHVAAKSQAAEMSMRDIMGTGLFSDAVTNDKLLDGLDGLCDTDNTYPSMNGGLNRSNETWWQAGFRDEATYTGSPTFTTLQWGVGTLTEQPNSPTLGITTQTLYNSFMDQLDELQRYNDPGLAQMGFDSVTFRGIPVVVDSHAADNYWFWLNENYLDLVSHKEENFDFQPFRMAYNQKAMVAYIFWTGNLVCNNCRFQGAYTVLGTA